MSTVHLGPMEKRPGPCPERAGALAIRALPGWEDAQLPPADFMIMKTLGRYDLPFNLLGLLWLVW